MCNQSIPYPPNQDKTFPHFTQKKASNLRIARRLMESADKSLQKRGKRMEACSVTISYQYCPSCKKVHLEKVAYCRDRLCPVCGWRLSAKRFGQMVRVMEKIESESYDFYFLTLTVRNCSPVDLQKTMQKISSSWGRMRKHVWFSENIVGWAKSQEITYNRAENTFHPHVHIILVLSKSSKLNEKKLRQLCRQSWKFAVRSKYTPITDVREIYDKKTRTVSRKEETGYRSTTPAVLETFKYAVKGASLEKMPQDALEILAKAISGFRLVSYGGIIKTIRAEILRAEGQDPDAEETPDGNGEHFLTCPICTTPLQEMVAEWAFGEGVYRHGSFLDSQDTIAG